jgi:hypothetical protein
MDYDFWWHLRTGQSIIDERQVPATDTFSRYGLETGKPWQAYSWLYEAMLYGSYLMLGLQGVVLFRLILVLTVVVAIHGFIARHESRFPVAASLFAAALLALGTMMYDRPWLFTILFSTFLLDVLLDLRGGRAVRRLWLLPVIFALWANLHIQFVHGLLILGIACIAPIADRLFGKQDAATTPWWQLALLTVLCTVATLANPYGFGLYHVVMGFAADQTPMDVIIELRPLEFRGFRDFVMPALAGFALHMLGRRQRWSFFEVLLIIAAGWFSFRSRRDLWFMTLVALAILVSPGAGSQARSQSQSQFSFRPAPLQAALLAIILTLFTAYVWSIRLKPGTIESTLAEDYPVGAIRFVKERGYAGPLYNAFNWGGYLIWNLRELPVSMDGRSNIQGGDRTAQAYATWSSFPGWDRDPDLFTSQIVIEDAGAPVTATMRTDSRFKIVYEDKRAAVFEVTRQQ